MNEIKRDIFSEIERDISELQETARKQNEWWRRWRLYQKAQLSKKEREEFELESAEQGIDVSGGWGMKL